MTCEQVNMEFAGLVHDHLMGANKLHHPSSSSSSNNNHHHHHHHNGHNGTYQYNSTPNEQQFNNNHRAQNGRNELHKTPVDIVNMKGSQVEKRQIAARGPTMTNKMINNGQQQENNFNSDDDQSEDAASSLSTIAILRRHPMHDSLVLVKKYRPCLDGYNLEFPNSFGDHQDAMTNTTTTTTTASVVASANTTTKSNSHSPSQSPPRRMSTESVGFLGKAYDVGSGRTRLVSVYLDGDDPIYQNKIKQQQNGAMTNNGTPGEQQEGGEIVYVPINGLLHRLNNYDRQGISIDSRVYAFAMGLKTAERFLTSSTEKEYQEAPPL